MNKIDRVLTGFIFGLFSPPLALFLYSIFFTRVSVQEFFRFITTYHLLAPVISLCAIVNLAVFFLFIWKEKDRAAKGVLMATFLYAFYIVYLKLF